MKMLVALQRISFALFFDFTTFSLFLDTTKACTNFLQSDRLLFSTFNIFLSISIIYTYLSGKIIDRLTYT